jgi:hypothetical protein
MQGWCEHIRPCWHAYERLYLFASKYSEGSIPLHALMNTTYAALTLLRCRRICFLRGDGMLCQK